MYSNSYLNTGMSGKFDHFMFMVRKEFKRTSTFRIVILAIVFHSLLSILLIHNYLNHYSNTYHSKHVSSHNHPDKGQISVSPKRPTNEDIDFELKFKLAKIDFSDHKLFGPKSANLLSSKLIKTQELTHIGWFNDHLRWEEKVQCFNNRWMLCDKVYLAKCKPNSIRAIYQYVPFKLARHVRHLYFSLRASSEQLVEQSNDGFFGMLALIQFIDGTNDLIRLKFQFESEAWSIRSKDYRCGKTIVSVTVMLTCFGYSGIASFTDIRLSSEHAGLDPIHSPFEICSWCSPQTYPKQLLKIDSKHEILKITPEKNKRSNKQSQLTFVSQVSMDRLNILERSLLTWDGPVSIAIHIPISSNSTQTIQDWQRLYINKKISSLNISTEKSTIILVPSLDSDHYPINSLRNLAIKMVQTRFMFLVDADFQPSPNLESNFLNTLAHYHGQYLKHFNENDLMAFIVPAFEYLEMPSKEDPVLRSKEELLQLIHRDDSMIEPFRMHESNEVQGMTNYWKWYYARKPYNISCKFHDKYEPYVIVQKSPKLPLYDENLVNYGMNKVMHITEMFASNYTFQVLDDVWAIHMQHQSTPYYLDFLKNLTSRLRNRAQRFQVLDRIIHQNNIKLIECHFHDQK